MSSESAKIDIISCRGKDYLKLNVQMKQLLRSIDSEQSREGE